MDVMLTMNTLRFNDPWIEIPAPVLAARGVGAGELAASDDAAADGEVDVGRAATEESAGVLDGLALRDPSVVADPVIGVGALLSDSVGETGAWLDDAGGGDGAALEDELLPPD